METRQTSGLVALAHVEITGPEYSLEIENDVRQALGDAGFPVVVTGEHSVAAGSSLSYEVTCFIFSSIASSLIYDVFKFAMKKMAEAFHNAGVGRAPRTKARVVTEDCELVLSANVHAGVDADAIPYDELITKMCAFVSSEADKGNPVKRVEAPCELVAKGDHVTTSCHGVGNIYLWRVTYKDGKKWPVAVFDAVNDCFVDLSEAAPLS